MNYVYAILGLVAGFFTARTFFKAGSFKRTASKEALLGAQIGWVANVPMGFVRIVGWLEILGAIGVVAAPVFAYVTGLGWAQIIIALAGVTLGIMGEYLRESPIMLLSVWSLKLKMRRRSNLPSRQLCRDFLQQSWVSAF